MDELANFIERNRVISRRRTMKHYHVLRECPSTFLTITNDRNVCAGRLSVSYGKSGGGRF